MLEAVGEGKRIIETIERRKKNWIGHVVRGDGLSKVVLKGRIEGVARWGGFYDKI